MDHGSRGHPFRSDRRRGDLLGPVECWATAPPPSGHFPIWEIHRDLSPGLDRFEIYLEGHRIGEELNAAALRELLFGAMLARDEVNRVIAKLETCPIVWVELPPKESSACREAPPAHRD